jgi:hypothetical protein
MGKPRGRSEREHMSQSVGSERVSIISQRPILRFLILNSAFLLARGQRVLLLPSYFLIFTSPVCLPSCTAFSLRLCQNQCTRNMIAIKK